MAKSLTYYVNWQLEHDGKTYPQGKTIELNPETAAPLLVSGVLSTEPQETAEDPEVNPEGQ